MPCRCLFSDFSKLFFQCVFFVMFDLSSLFLLVFSIISLKTRSFLPPRKKKIEERKQITTKKEKIISHNLCKCTVLGALHHPSILSKGLYNSYLYFLPTCTKPRDESLVSLQVFSEHVVCLGTNVIFYVSQNARVLACPNFPKKHSF